MSITSNTVKNDLRKSKDKIHESSTDLAKEFKTFVSDVESMLKDTASLTGDELAQAKIKINQRIATAKQCIKESSDSMLDQARKTATVTNEYVHEKPWAVIGTGALVSLVLGILLGHREENSPK